MSIVTTASVPGSTLLTEIAVVTADRFAQARELAPTYETSPPADDGIGSNPYDTAIRYLTNRNGRDQDGVLRIAADSNGRRTTYPLCGASRWSLIDLLCLRVKACAYTIRARRQVTGHTFGHREVSDWEEIISHLDTLLRTYNGKKVKELSHLTADLTVALTRAWKKKHGRHAVLNSFLTNSFGQCLEVLLDYVSYCLFRRDQQGPDAPAEQKTTCNPM